MPLHVLDSSPVWGKAEPHWLSRLTDHMETRPRCWAEAKRSQPLGVGHGEVLARISFWPIITVAPIRCQICSGRSSMP